MYMSITVCLCGVCVCVCTCLCVQVFRHLGIFHQSHNVLFKKVHFTFIYMCACVYVRMCAAPEEARRGRSWNGFLEVQLQVAVS